jgi:ABC-type Fe3+-hydroxamate transport system substrate-binding protein
MSLTRRALLAASAALLVPPAARAASITDAAGRAIAVPETVARVFPAGPPAAIMLYTLALDLLLGWPRPIGRRNAHSCCRMSVLVSRWAVSPDAAIPGNISVASC